ncbi:MAG: hypothetical protein JWR84_2979 [Caulobacter sp.]|nr:hypothetical protein [Caulobacter sp.]
MEWFKDVGIPVLTFVGGAVLVLLLMKNRYSVSVKQVNLPFVEFEISKFNGLSPVVMFSRLTRMLILPAEAEKVEKLLKRDGASRISEPVAMIHAGWTVVCDAFVYRFKSYPSDQNVHAIAESIGGQNAEFIIMFRRIYELSLRHVDKIEDEFALEYLKRGPTLADRILGTQRLPKDGLARDLVQQHYDH